MWRGWVEEVDKIVKGPDAIRCDEEIKQRAIVNCWSHAQ